jgi:hypothetical protein
MDEQTKDLENTEATAETESQSKAESAKSTDWKAEARKWEARAKENKAKADEFEEYKTKTASELESFKSRAEKAEGDLAVLQHAKEVKEWCKSVSDETGIPQAVLEALKTETLEGLKAEAEKLTPYFKKSVAPTVASDTGVSNQIKEVSEDMKFATQLFSKR